MKINMNMILGVVAAVAGVIILFVGGWFGLLVGIVAILMGLALLVRGFRQRSTAT
jgi:succinate-acetate transporter protein